MNDQFAKIQTRDFRSLFWIHYFLPAPMVKREWTTCLGASCLGDGLSCYINMGRLVGGWVVSGPVSVVPKIQLGSVLAMDPWWKARLFWCSENFLPTSQNNLAYHPSADGDFRPATASRSGKRLWTNLDLLIGGPAAEEDFFEVVLHDSIVWKFFQMSAFKKLI